ncbi:MAG TPA: hypothetical protein VFP36_15040, partial [Usitatibacter sp.]|nr:hypothetical protein [Usitatibacter sp.]
EEMKQLLAEGSGLPRIEPLPQCDHAIEAARFHGMTPENLAREALHAVAVPRGRHEPPREGDAEARSLRRSGYHVHDREAPAQLARSAQDRAEGAASAESVATGKALGAGIPRHRKR